jgi:hypothetical protein
MIVLAILFFLYVSVVSISLLEDFSQYKTVSSTSLVGVKDGTDRNDLFPHAY